MWDFSWLERRWPGAGYEDWGVALDELAERGYNAVRIDAYPHLLAADAERDWDIEVLWTTQDWGSPAPTRVRVWPALPDFIHACSERGIRVALSSWFRQDAANARMNITTECWGIIDYKDWPLLDWGWVKDTCELGTLTAASTGRWAAIATSNFCGPQFRGMWRDIAWHQSLTRAIKAAPQPV